jgi:hypothetical protein
LDNSIFTVFVLFAVEEVLEVGEDEVRGVMFAEVYDEEIFELLNELVKLPGELL